MNIRIPVLFLFTLGLCSRVSAQDKFYDYYDKGEEYIKKQDWLRAIEEFKSAASLEYEDRNNKRTYGTRFIEYYPHREMGIAYFNLGEYASARKELELSLAYKSTGRAKKYLEKVNSIGSSEFESEKMEKITAEERLRIEEQDRKLKEQEAQIQREAETRKRLEQEAKEKAERDARALAEKIVREKQLKEAAEKAMREAKDKAEKERLAAEAAEREEKTKAEQARLAKAMEEAARQKEKEDIEQKAFLDQQKKMAEERVRLDKEKLKLTLNKKLVAKNASNPGSIVSAEALLYDATLIPQVGSRLTMAVLPFEGSSSANIREIITDKLVTALVQLRRFRVAERGAVDKVIREQDFQMSDLVDQNDAVKVGEMAGADAIVIGSLKENAGAYVIGVRVVDVTSGETIAATDCRAKNTESVSLDDAAAQLSADIYNQLPLTLGIVVSLENGDEAYLDIGANSNIRKGMKVVVFREGDVIVHPVTKEVLGKKVTRLGEFVVTDVQEKLTNARMIKKEKDAVQIGDRVVVK